ncbi:MAG TPA: DUF4405 domain-containing protein [Candidatus Gemmiger faecigallinarum]|nr:DUF4405 domain-containing protein [Candidatus Gemmiger faecigallinarum]
MARMAVDLAMTVLLLLLMARQITGDDAHEWLGAAMFVLWLLHHLLNRRWYAGLAKGAWTPMRAVQLACNLLLLAAMLGVMVSGVILSRQVFGFLGISGGRAMAQPVHICCSFWAFVLMALHLGLHWNMVLGMARKAAGPLPRPAAAVLRLAGVAAALYGVYAFVRNQIPSYLFLTTHFVFFDYERPAALFFADYLAMLALFVLLAHRLTRLLQAAAHRQTRRR